MNNIEFDTRLAKLIFKRNKRTDFCGAIVYGPRGAGKSSFCLKTLADLYKNGFEMTEDEAYREALDHMLYDMPEITSTIQDLLENGEGPEPALILDDAGIYLGSTQYWSRVKFHSLMKSLLDSIRLASSSLLLTVPSPKTLIKYARAFDDYFIKITRRSGDYRRLATIYAKYTLPSGKTWISKKGKTKYTCRLPEWVYKEHVEKRRNQLEGITKEIQTSIEEAEA